MPKDTHQPTSGKRLQPRKVAMGAAGAAALLAPMLAFGSPASAAHGDSYYEGYSGTISELNGSGVSGTIDVDLLDGNRANITIEATGLLPDQPHAQHIHGVLTVANNCPTIAADTSGDGIISTVEGIPSYGGIQASLTTEGDTSADSALAVERFPVTADGNLTYQRTITIPGDVATYLGNLHVVMHGIDVNGNGEYDFEAGPSSLTEDLPLEATAPAACGSLDFEGVNLPPAYRDLDPNTNEAFIVRSYTSLLGRAPDAEGFDFWVEQRTNGTWTPERMIDFFATSPEFEARYGALLSEASDTEWIDFIYQSVLGRLPDAPGRTYWEGRLNSDLSRVNLIIWFSDSPEYRGFVHNS